MNIVENEESYDTRQNLFVAVIAKAVKDDLIEHGIDEDEAHSLTGDITFRICALLDGSQKLKEEGVELHPALLFRKKEKSDDYFYLNSGSWMHEYAFGFADAVFEDDDENEEEVENSSGDMPDIETLCFQALVTYSSGVQVMLDISSVMGVEFDVSSLADSFYDIIDPTTERIVRSISATPSELSTLFSKIESIEIKDEITDDSKFLEISGFSKRDFKSFYLKLKEECKKLQQDV